MNRRRSILALSSVVLLAALTFAGLEPAQNPFAAKPQKEHALLEKLSGKWNATFRMGMSGMPPIASKGAESGELMGGLWLISRYDDPHMMGGAFAGIQVLGFDPRKGKYVASWADNQSTHLAVQEGTWDEATKTLTLAGESPDPMSGKSSKSTMVVRFTDDDHRTSTLLAPGPDGKEMEIFTIEYERAP